MTDTEDKNEKSHILKEHFREICGKIREDKTFISIVFITTFGILLVTGFIAMTLHYQPTGKSAFSPDAFQQQKSLPDDYLNPFPPSQLKEKIVEIIKEVPAKPHEILDPRKLFTLREGREPTLSEEETLRHDLMDIRRQRSTIYIAPEKEDPFYKRETIQQDASKDEDYKKQKEEKNFASYPVDLSRTLTEDRFIPAVLITEIKSELPSEKVLAQIEVDVYSSHGRNILIPKGSKAIGKYKPLKAKGDSRLQINWERIITPDGINIKINTETADEQGSSGMGGLVDNRVMDKYGEALLTSSISALAQMTVSTANQAQASTANSFSQSFGNVTSELLKNSLDISPRITISMGTRIVISPLTDLWFKEPIKNTAEIITLKEALK